MIKSEPIKLKTFLVVNGHKITHVVIGRHYQEKHSSYMTDELVLDLVHLLDGKKFEHDSTSRGIEYYVADFQMATSDKRVKTYRLVWLFEGNYLEVIGVVNAYRIKKSRK